MAQPHAALAHYRELGRSEQITMALGNLAEAGLEQGDFDAAGRYLREGMALAWQLGLLPRATVLLFVHARLLHATGEPEQAASILRLIRAHPATGNQTQPQIDGLLAAWGCAIDGEAAALEAVVAEMLTETRH